MAKKLKLEVEFTVHDDCSLPEAVLRAAIRLKQFAHENNIVVVPQIFKDDLHLKNCDWVEADGIRDR